VKRAFLLLALACVAGPLMAQQVTAVGICNWTQVLTTSYKESKSVRELEDLRQAILKESQAISRDISDLENQKLDADKAGNKDLSLQMEKRLADRRAYLDDYRRIKNDAYKRQAEKVLSSVQFIKEIREAIHFVAEDQGFSLVLRSDGAYSDLILDNTPEIDITQKVINRIYALAGKTPPAGGQ
jgi:Skp family chaperone for outer membrane proteins